MLLAQGQDKFNCVLLLIIIDKSLNWQPIIVIYKI